MAALAGRVRRIERRMVEGAMPTEIGPNESWESVWSRMKIPWNAGHTKEWMVLWRKAPDDMREKVIEEIGRLEVEDVGELREPTEEDLAVIREFPD